MCGVGFDQIENFDLFEMNPDFIEVLNEVYDDEIFVLNGHPDYEPVKIIEGVNGSKADNLLEVGFWRVKYKLIK